MAALATQNVVDAGTKPTYVQAGASDTAEIGSGHNTFAHYRNASGSSVNLTVTAPGTTDYGQALPDPVIAVANNGEAWIPLRKDYDPGDGTGRATIATSAQNAALTVAVVRMS